MKKTPLKKWLKEKNIKVSEFAERLRIHRTHLSDIIYGHVKPSKALAKLIEYETQGEVKEEWLVFPEAYKEEIEKYLKEDLVGVEK